MSSSRIGFFFHAAYWNLIFGKIGLLVLFTLTLKRSSHSKESSVLENEIFQSSQVHYSGIVLLAISLPLLLDVALNLYSQNLFKNNNGILIGRACYTVSTILFGSQLTLQYDILHIFPSYEISFWFLLGSYRIAFLSTIMFFISITDPTTESNYPTITVTLLGCIAVLFNTLKFGSIFLVNSLTLLYITFFSFFLIRRNLNIWKQRTAYSHFLYVNLCFLFYALGYCIRLLMYYQPSCISTTCTNKIVYEAFPLISIYTYVIMAAVITVIPGWVAHNEAMSAKDQVIATKTAYQRYISHEMRSPLNATNMGIQYCLGKIPENTLDIEQKDIRDTLVEANRACDDGLAILDDLLTYDNAENGHVQLCKENVNIKNFISDYLKLFSLQIQSKNIKLELMNYADLQDLFSFDEGNEHTSSTSNTSLVMDNASTTDDNINFNTISYKSNQNNKGTDCFKAVGGTCVEDEDTVSIDKSKWGQVLRSIISNAIKFTPNKGTMKVCMTFIPNKVDNDSKTSDPIESETYLGHFYRILTTPLYLFQTQNKITNTDTKYISSMRTRPSRKNIANTTSSSILLNEQRQSTSNNSNRNNFDSSNEKIINGMLVIEIQDSGVGMTSENQSVLFNEFFQFNPEKLQAGGGSGLGLWISKSIVDMHGGRINLYSEGEGKGSTFRLEIPMTRVNDDESVCSTTHSRVNNSRPLKIPQRLLLVDDVGTNRKFLRKLLEQRGHDCEEAEDGLEALNMVKASSLDYYDVILMDFVMPNMNGPNATRAIRQLGYTGPIIGVTGNVLDEDRIVFMNAGATNVVIKPLKMNKLLDFVTL